MPAKKKKKTQRVTNKPGVSYRKPSQKKTTKKDVDKFMKKKKKK